MADVDDQFVFAAVAAQRRNFADLIEGLDEAQLATPSLCAGWDVKTVAALRENADRPVSSPVFGPRGPLADILVHSGDVRIALGMPFEPDPECAVSAMDFLTGGWPIGFLPLGRLRGIRLSASDVRQSWRDGAEVSGPVGALMMGVCGRTVALDALDGPGMAVLRQRLSV